MAGRVASRSYTADYEAMYRAPVGDERAKAKAKRADHPKDPAPPANPVPPTVTPALAPIEPAGNAVLASFASTPIGHVPPAVKPPEPYAEGNELLVAIDRVDHEKVLAILERNALPG